MNLNGNENGNGYWTVKRTETVMRIGTVTINGTIKGPKRLLELDRQF